MPICPKCGNPAPDGARFCEHDGTRLDGAAPLAAPTPVVLSIATPPGCKCGAGADAQVDGFGSVCGLKWVPARVLLPRDHVELTLSPTFGGVTDRGNRHSRNEDDLALFLGDDGTAVIVVCDGVSSSEEADRASAIAAKTVCDRLAGVVAGDGEIEIPLATAIAAANAAVSALAVTGAGATTEPPETTLVAAFVRERTATIAWVGDSRAYWLDPANPADSLALTRDHSWVNDMLDAGTMGREEAEKNRLAHAITRCLGFSSDPESSQPTVTTFALPDTGGILLLCSDGLWNYADSAARLIELAGAAAGRAGAAGDAVTISRALVQFANDAGGRDNITAAVLMVAARI